MDDLIAGLPAWVSSVPIWGLFATVLIAVIKIWPTLQAQAISERLAKRDRYITRITELEAAVEECRRQCDEDQENMRVTIDGLRDEIYGLRRQHVQEQISMINSIIESVDSPVLKNLLKTLQSVQSTLPTPKASAAMIPVNGPVEDKGQP